MMMLINECSKAIRQTSTASSLCRSFFASSTDHSTLLANAQVHCVPTSSGDEYGPRQYILIPNDTPLEIAMKVDKLHLARLSANKNILFRAKVVQRSLGCQADVCKLLLDKALSDISSKGDCGIAMASLDGLCKWTSNAIGELEGSSNETKTISRLEAGEQVLEVLTQWRQNDEQLYEAIKAIATGIPRPGHSVVGQGTYRDGEEGWTRLAELFVDNGLPEEATLYQNNGGKFKSIEHLADTSTEGLMYSGGAMAKFEF